MDNTNLFAGSQAVETSSIRDWLPEKSSLPNTQNSNQKSATLSGVPDFYSAKEI